MPHGLLRSRSQHLSRLSVTEHPLPSASSANPQSSLRRRPRVLCGCPYLCPGVPPVKSHSIGSDEAAPGILGGGQSAASLRRRALWTPGTASAGPPMSLVRQKEPDPHLKGRSRHLRDHLREPSREGRTSVLALPPKLPTFHPVPEQARATAGCSQGTAKSAQTG